MAFVNFDQTKIVDVDSIVAVERGKWSDDQQDWKAVLVHTSGAKIETECWFSAAPAWLNELKATQK